MAAARSDQIKDTLFCCMDAVFCSAVLISVGIQAVLKKKKAGSCLMMSFTDLRIQQQKISADLQARIQAVLAHGHYIMGPEVAELEARLCQFTGAQYCIGCASGTNALELVLSAWGIGAGDAVFTTPFSFTATAETIARTGAVPVFIDIDPRTFNFDVPQLENAILAVQRQDRSLYPLPKAALAARLTPRAIVSVDIFGNAMPYDQLLPIAEKHHLLVLEDGAQGFGGGYKGKKLCNCGCHAAATSFFPSKPLGCYGDGGAVFTNDAELAALVDSLRYHGRVDATHKYDNIRLGCNGRLDTLQAAILLAKMAVFEEECSLRRKVAARYTAILQGVPQVLAPQETEGAESIWAQYTILLPEGAPRAAIMAGMKEAGVPTAIHYPKGLHTQGCFASFGYTPHDLPVTQAVCSRVLSLPMHPYLSEGDQARVVQALEKALSF